MDKPRLIRRNHNTETSVFLFENTDVICTVIQREDEKSNSQIIHTVGGTEKSRLEAREFFRKRSQNEFC